ncbi:MAG: hypothetical protein Q9172_002663 [Xanthocarpia lactea]
MDDSRAATKPPQEVVRSFTSQSAETATDHHNDVQDSDVEEGPRKMPILRHKRAKATKAKKFPLMELPPEIRTMVYEEVLVASPSISIISQRSAAFMGYTAPRRVLYILDDSARTGCQLLRASKALYHEAMPIFYGRNTFDFGDLDALDGFLKKISIQQRRMITSVALRIRGTTPAKSIRLLQGCVSLRRLEVKVIMGTLDGYDLNRLGQPRAAGIRSLLEIRGINELDVTLPQFFYIWDDQQREAFEELKKALQVLKLPRSIASLRRQDAKDFPPEKAKRTVFGRANVLTRSERAALSKDSNQGHA